MKGQTTTPAVPRKKTEEKSKDGGMIRRCLFCGYNRRYNWFVMGLTENALDVMTRMGRFIYYRLQPKVIHLQAGGEPLECDGGDSFVFADGVVVSITDGKLQGVSRGTTYIQKYVADTNGISDKKRTNTAAHRSTAVMTVIMSNDSLFRRVWIISAPI